MKNLGLIVQYLYPDANPIRDFCVQDDGSGPRIAKWDEAKLGKQPTENELKTAETDALAASAALAAKSESDRSALDALRSKPRTIWTDADVKLAAQIAISRLI
jgi:hypothetical protein